MERPLDLLDELRDVVEREPRPQAAQVACLGRPYPGGWGLRESSPKRVVDDLAEGQARSPGERLELGRHVLVKRQRCPHTVMLVPWNRDSSRFQGTR